MKINDSYTLSLRIIYLQLSLEISHKSYVETNEATIMRFL
jgi:hypothetical protein